MRYRDLTAIGERGLLPGRALPFDNRHLMARLAQKPRRGRTDNARAEDKDLHA